MTLHYNADQAKTIQKVVTRKTLFKWNTWLLTLLHNQYFVKSKAISYFPIVIANLKIEILFKIFKKWQFNC